MSQSIFEKKIFKFVLVSFSLGGCAEQIVHNQASCWGYKFDVLFLQYHILTSIHAMNDVRGF